MTKRLRPGDVLEIAGTTGVLYLCYLGKHPEYGDTVEVCPAEQTLRWTEFDELFRSAYVAFYPATAAVSRGFAAMVGHRKCAPIPTALRRPGARVGTSVKTWIVEGPSGESVKQALSADELCLPIAVIWNHEMLVQRVSEGWRPEQEGT